MNIAELKKKFPIKHGKDHGEPLTLGTIATRIREAMEANASELSRKDIACDIIDRDFLFGAWGDKWTDYDVNLLRDIRGLILAAYMAGKGWR